MTGWSAWLDQHRLSMQRASPWQWIFAEQVLSQVPGLDPEWVEAEHPFQDLAGRTRRMDFAVRRPDVPPLAVEVDGYNKDQAGGGMSSAQFSDFLLRQNALTAAGWQVLRFSNVLLRENAAECRRQISLVLSLPAGTASSAAPLEPLFGPGVCGIHGLQALPVAYGYFAGLDEPEATVIVGGCYMKYDSPAMACPSCYDSAFGWNLAPSADPPLGEDAAVRLVVQELGDMAGP